MTRKIFLPLLVLAAAVALAGCESTSSSGGGYGSGYEQPDDRWFTRLVGAAGDGAESQLGLNDFRRVDSFDSGYDGEGSVWYNADTGQCLQMIVVNDRVDSAKNIQSHPRCRR